MPKIRERVARLRPNNLPKGVRADSGKPLNAKLDYNESVYGPSPKARSVIGINPHLYPVKPTADFVKTVAGIYDVGEDHVFAASGSDALIDLVPVVFGGGSDANVVMPEFSYGRMERTCLALGVEVRKVPLPAYDIDLEGILDAVDKNTAAIYLVNPNMPTGKFMGEAEIRNFLANVPNDVAVVFDHAYSEYVTPKERKIDEASVMNDFANVVFLHTLSKYYGLAGVRIGYALAADPKVIEAFADVSQPSPVSELALLAGDAALNEGDWYEKNVLGPITEARAFFMKGLDESRIVHSPSVASFVYVDTSAMGLDNREVAAYLLSDHGVAVRPVMDRGLRVTVGTIADMSLVLDGLKAYLAKHGLRR